MTGEVAAVADELAEAWAEEKSSGRNWASTLLRVGSLPEESSGGTRSCIAGWFG